MPVCTSSRANSAPASAAADRGARPGSPAGAGSTPPSPSIGSSSTMAVDSPTAAASASPSPKGTYCTPPGSGAKAAAFDGCPVRASAPIVRPWKAPSAVITSGRPVSRLILKAISLASAPELQKKTRPGRPASSSSRSASSDAGLVHRQVGDVPELLRLRGDRLDDLRVRVAEDRRRDAAEQVGVLAAVDVGQTVAPGAVVQRDRRRLVVAHHHGRPAGGQLLGAVVMLSPPPRSARPGRPSSRCLRS